MKKVIFLDRDGTLNKNEKGKYIHRPDQWHWKPRAREALQLFRKAGYHLVLITNQSGVGRGLYNNQDVEQVHSAMEKDLRAYGVTFDVIATCFHERDAGCFCRKPSIGMLATIERATGPIDYAASWTIGDTLADAGFGKNSGTRTALLRSTFWRKDKNFLFHPDLVSNSLYEAAKFITRKSVTTSTPHSQKILSLREAMQIASKLRRKRKKIVTVNGSFDLLHAGHLALLTEAREQGNVLFVGINSDQSVREGKGVSRPYIPAKERATLLAALAVVDYVSVIEAPYSILPSIFIKAIRPHIHVNGSEYGKPSTWIEWPAIQAVGARTHTVLRRPGLSTSAIVKKIRSS